MSRLEEAARRLERAVERLETATSAASGAASGSNPETKRLAAALASAKADYAALAEAAGTVATRLDGTIARLSAVIDE